MIQRGAFLASTTAALMTGGLDIWSPPSPGGLMRILISSDRAGETPRALAADGFFFGGKRWRGTWTIVGLPSGREGVVAAMELDTYLCGVVPLEVSPSWPASALEAQAIVARTYALARRTLSRPYDLVITQSDQRYGGPDAEAEPTSAAVAATRGQTLAFAGGPASVFYGACCGGHTADAAAIWGHSMLPYLRGVPDPYCAPAPDYRWRRRVPLERIRAVLGSRVPGDISGFALGEPDDSGRPNTIDIFGKSGRSSVSAIEFRRLIGADVVRSTWIRTMALDRREAPLEVAIEGSGRGHGVGFCQWGARFMSTAGASARSIVGYYFPGTSITGG